MCQPSGCAGAMPISRCVTLLRCPTAAPGLASVCALALSEAVQQGLDVPARPPARVSTAGSVAEALDYVRQHRPDVVVSDIGMPGEDGYALIKKLRALPSSQGGKTPAIALTAYARFEDRTKALVSGFNMHITKPVEPTELIAVLVSLAALFSKS